jgi:hypothetical protein
MVSGVEKTVQDLAFCSKEKKKKTRSKKYNEDLVEQLDPKYAYTI